MVLQTFATHFLAIVGGVRVQELDVGEAQVALALSVASVSMAIYQRAKLTLTFQVERAYMLWRDNAISMESLGEMKRGDGVAKAIIKTTNPTTGKESKATAFNETNWGITTRNYLKSIKNLHAGTFAKIVAMAQDYAKLSRPGFDIQVSGTGSNEDERALLVDITDDDGKFISISHSAGELIVHVTRVIPRRHGTS
jgi:hypothetical protein